LFCVAEKIISSVYIFEEINLKGSSLPSIEFDINIDIHQVQLQVINSLSHYDYHIHYDYHYHIDIHCDNHYDYYYHYDYSIS